MSDSATATESDGPAPATGPAVEGTTYSFRLPAGWKQKTEGMAEGTTGGLSPKSLGFNYLLVGTNVVRNFDDVSSLSPDVLRSFRGTANKGRVLPATEWAGEPAYHLAGDDSIAGFAEQFGVIWRDAHVRMYFDFDDDGGKDPWSPADRRELIESVEASWEWK